MPLIISSRLFAGLRLIAAASMILVTASRPFAEQYQGENVKVDVGGYRLNSVLLAPGPKADLPPIVFIHGASTSLLDPMFSFRDKLEGRAELLFVDRPGHGLSESDGERTTYPDAQADAIATLMEKRGVRKAIVVGHSFGGSVAAALAVGHPDKVGGLVFLSPAVYPWPDGIAWYYEAAKAPVTGWLFSGLIVPPLGLLTIDKAADAVFSPNSRPENYVAATEARRAIAPTAFRYNAMEIANLKTWVEAASKRYSQIAAPTVIITGDTDEIVSPQIHSEHLARDIRGARLVTVRNLGHKSDYVARDLAVAAIELVAGKRRDLEAIKNRIERRIAGDRRH